MTKKNLRLKSQNISKDSQHTFRCTSEEMNKIRQKAELYTGGNISQWVLYCAMNYVPSGDELEEKETNKRRRK